MLSLLFRDTGLNRLRCAVNQVFRLFQAKTCDLFNDLDNTNLSLTAANEIGFSAVTAEEPEDFAITVAATDGLATLTLTLETEDEALTAIMTGMGLTEPFELSDPTEAQIAGLDLIEFPYGEDVVEATEVEIPLNKLFATLVAAFPAGAEFSIVIDATDANELEADTATLAIALVDDTPYVTITGIGDEPVAITAADAEIPAIEIAAVTSIETLVVEITSENEAFTAALAVAGITGAIDLANPGALGEALTGLGLPNGADVKGKQELSIDISNFVPMMFALIAEDPAATLDAAFKITVTDPEEHSADKTLTLNLSHPAEEGGEGEEE